MLEFLRKHQYGLMLGVAVIVIIAFAFLYDSGNYTGQGKGPSMQLYGQNISPTQMRKYENQASLVTELGFLDLFFSLRGFQRSAGDNQDLITNLLVLRKEAESLGIKASDEDIQEAIKNHRPFQDQATGAFSQEYFDRTMAMLPSRGLNEADLQQLFADTVSLRKLQQLLKAGMRPSPTTIESEFAEENASIAAFRLDFTAEKHASDAANVTDEELEEFFEENKSDYMTPEKRSAQYVLFRKPELEKRMEEAKAAAAAAAEEATAPVKSIEPAKDSTKGKMPTKPSAPDSAKEKTKTTGTPKGTSKKKNSPKGDKAKGGEGNAPAPKPAEETEDAGETPPKTETGGREALQVEPTQGTTGGPAPDAEKSTPAKEETKEAEPVETPALQEKKEPESPAPNPAPEIRESGSPSLAPDAEKEDSGPSPEELRAQNLEYNKAMNNFLQEANADVTKFPEIAQRFVKESEGKSYSVEFFDTGLFDRENPPESLLQKNGEPESMIIEAIFRRPAVQPLSREAVRDLDSGFVLFRVVETALPEQREFEDAKEDVKKDYIERRTSEILQEVAEKTGDEIKKSITDGKSFEDAAKAVDAEFLSIPPFTSTSPPPAIEDWPKFSAAVAETASGQFSDPIPGEDKTTLVYVAAREVRDLEDENVQRDIVKSRISSQNYDRRLLEAWLQKAREDAGAYKGDLGLGS